MSVDPNTGEVKRERPRVQKVFTKPSRTLQAFLGPSDVHAIMRKYQSTGDVSVLLQRRPQDAIYGDFSRPLDYVEAFNKVAAARALFEELPSEIRDAVNNDPAKLLELVSDPRESARARCKELGLVHLVPEVPAPGTPEAQPVVAPGATAPVAGSTAPVPAA